MKKKIALVLVLGLALAAAGCGKKTDTKKTTEAPKTSANAVEQVVNDASKAVEEVVSEAGDAVEAVSEKADEIVSEAEEAVEGVSEALSEAEGVVDDASEAVDEALSEAGELASEVEEAVSEAADEVESEIEEAVSEAVELESEVEEAVEKFAEDPFAETEEESSEEAMEPVEVDYAGYVEAELDTPVIVEAYVQAHQSWWNDQITVYAADEDGAYFFYNMACSEEDAEKLVPGTKIRVTGYKSEWSGEVEVVDATFEFVEDADEFIAEAKDVTELLGTDELAESQNQFVSFKGLTVEASTDADGNEAAFLYNWDGSGSQDANSDLYFNASYDGETYTFTVESYLCDNTTDVYKAVEGLEIGDEIDLEGFLYWYNGANPHITAVTVK